MARYFDKYTANGVLRQKKPSLINSKSVNMDAVRKSDEGKVLVRIDKNTVKYITMEKIENLRDEVVSLLMKQIEGKNKTPYQLNLATGINLSTCAQVVNGTWNPTFNTLLDFKEKYSK